MSAGFVRAGFVADGVWKILVGTSMLVLFRFLVGTHHAPGWLLVATAVAVLAGGAAELLYVVRRATGSHTKYLIGYDAGWVLASVAALMVAASNVGLAWVLWLGYQVVAAPVVALVFLRAARRARRAL